VQKVVDSNALQSDELRAYLSANSKNAAVLCEFSGIEMHKGNALKNAVLSMEILSAYPTQAIVLKNTGQLCGLRTRESGLRRRMIDENSTKGFPEFCRQLARAAAGDTSVQARILAQGKAAAAVIDQFSTRLADVVKGRQDVAKTYSKEEVRLLRRSAQIPSSLARKILQHVFALFGILLANHPSVTKQPGGETMKNHYLFRFALCAHVWMLDWIAAGSNEGRPEQLRNDMVDMQFIVCATYFDGLLTADAKARRIYEHTVNILAAISHDET
jgi:hypothetical protein